MGFAVDADVRRAARFDFVLDVAWIGLTEIEQGLFDDTALLDTDQFTGVDVVKNAGIGVANNEGAGPHDLSPWPEPATLLIDQIFAEFGLSPFFTFFDFTDKNKNAAQRAILDIDPDDLAFALAANIGVLGDQVYSRWRLLVRRP